MKKSLIILVIIGLCIGSIFILTKDKKVKEDIKTKDKVMVNLVDKDVNEVDKLLGNLKFDIKYNYVYSDEYAKM